MGDVQAFGVKASEAIAFMKGKLPERSLAWDDLAGPVHSKVFAVAGATKLDLLNQLHEAIANSLEQGTTITSFRESFDKAVAEHGWSYNGSRGWRTQVIFDANMRSAHMAGRWAQLWAGKDRRPFLQYRTAGDARVRPAHRQWNGVIRAITDSFWSVFYPPNGWGCRCTVRAYSQGEVDSKGLMVDTEPFPVKTRTVTKAGEPVDRVPVGVDPGWDHNVGASWISPEVALGRKLLALPPDLRDKMVEKTVSPAFQTVLNDRWKAFRTAVQQASAPASAAQIVGFLDGPTISGLQSSAPASKVLSTAVAVTGDELAAMETAGAALDDLPEQIRNYRAVLWDTEAEALVVIPQEAARRKDGKAPTIHIRPATDGPAKGALAVSGVSRTRLTALDHTGRFKLLVGRLD